MSNVGIEQRLRRTYSEVGERTVVLRAPADTPTVPLRDGKVKRGRPLTLVWATVAVAAVAAVVAAGLLGRVPGRSGTGPGPLVHAVPGGLPGAMAGDVTPELPLVRIASTAARDVLEYAGDGRVLSITIERGAQAERGIVDPNAEIDGRPARLDTEGTRQLSWQPNSEILVTVRFEGGDVPALIAIAEQLVYIDAAGWEKAIEHAGFGRMSGDDRSGIIAEYELTTEVPTTVRIRGSLHTAFNIEFPNAGGSARILNNARDCTASTSLVPDADSTLVTVLLDSPGRAVIQGADGTSASVDVRVPIPGTGQFIEVVDLGDHPDQPWSCEVQR